MGKVHFKNNLMLITALLTALFLSSISTSVTRSLDGNDSSIMKSEAISPDGNSIAFGDNDAYMEVDADWEELPDGLLTIELDSDSDGLRGSVEDCESEQGGIGNETGCEGVTEFPEKSIDDGLMSDGFVIFSCFLGLLFTYFIFYTISKHDNAWWPLVIVFVILIGLSIRGMPLTNMISDDSASFKCPDGTVVTYGESMDFREENDLSIEEFLESPPSEWCDESLIWYEELTDEWFLVLVSTWAGILSFVCLLIIWRARTPMKLQNVKGQNSKTSKSSTKSHSGNGTIDHELIKQLIKKYNDNDVVLIEYQKITSNRPNPPKLSSIENAIRHRRGEHRRAKTPVRKNRSAQLYKQSKLSLASQGSSKSWAREAAKVKQRATNISERMKAEKESELKKFLDMISERYPEMVGKISEDKILQGLISAEKDDDYSWQTHFISALWMNDVEFDLTSQYGDWLDTENNPTFSPVLRESLAKVSGSLPTEPMNLDTDILSGEKSILPKRVHSEFAVDSNGIMTKRTSFSIVTINHISNRVEKVPTTEAHNQMFRDEIKVMKNLEDKGIDVGLLDYDLGEHPKIVTRYFGSHKLGEAIESASARGKKNIISGLIEQVSKIHKAGWIHRDLKPDNIMVDIRPRDGNHRFDAIIDYGIAMKINRKQMDIHNTAGTKFFGHSSQKETNFNASTGQDWFSVARIIALIIRGSSVESLNAEIQMSLSGLELTKEIRYLGFESKVVDRLSELIEESTNTRCDDLETVNRLSLIGKQIEKLF